MLQTIFAILLSVTSVHAASWNLNDVSVLFDLPKGSEDLNFMIGPQNLLPVTVFDQIKPLMLGVVDAPKDEYQALRVIGLRLDPCFKYVGSTKCFPQLRIVWQPVQKTKQNDFTTFDAGIHSFHELSSTEWKSLLIRIQNLKLKLTKLGLKHEALLGIHPALKNPSSRAIFMNEMKAITSEFAGKRNLSRVTFMKLFTPEIWWVFGGLEIKDGQFIKMELPRHDTRFTESNFFNDDFNNPMGMKGSITPELTNPSQEDDLTQLLKNYTYTFNTPAGLAYVKKSLETLDRVENPKLFTPETIDCVHCHVAQPTRAWFENKDRAYYRANQQTAFKYQGSVLTNTSANLKNPKSMRIFGYFGKTTAIGQRVINESAEVVKSLPASL